MKVKLVYSAICVNGANYDKLQQYENAQMKKLILMLLIMTGTAHAVSFDFEQHESYHRGGLNNQYAWTSRYEIGYFDETIHVDLDLRINGPFNDNWLMAETLWDKPDYDIDIDFFSTDPDYYIRSDPSVARSDMLAWDTDESFRMVAHEMGHMFGLFDEYAGGTVDPATGFTDSMGLMGNLSGRMRDRYYEPFDMWLEGKLASVPVAEAQPIPEPATVILLSFGLILRLFA